LFSVGEGKVTKLEPSEGSLSGGTYLIIKGDGMLF